MKLISYHSASVSEDTRSVRQSIKVCMHVRGGARSDVRVMREAMALIEAGFLVSILDIEQERTRPAEENVSGADVKHLSLTGSLISSHFKLWSLFKVLLS